MKGSQSNWLTTLDGAVLSGFSRLVLGAVFSGASELVQYSAHWPLHWRLSEIPGDSETHGGKGMSQHGFKKLDGPEGRKNRSLAAEQKIV